MRGVKLVISIGVLAALVAGVFFWFFGREEKVEQVMPAARENPAPEIFATGKVKPAEELRLSFQTAGLIQNIFVKEGEHVVRGQLLAELDRQELESRLKEAEAELSSKEASLASAQVELQSAKDALFTRIRDSYNKIDDAFFSNAEPLFAGGTFGLSIQEGATTYSFNTPDLNLRIRLNDQRRELLNLIPSWRQPISKENLLSEAKLVRERLEQVRDFIDDLAEAVSHFSTDKTTIAPILNSHRSAVSGAQSSISLAIVNLDSATQNLMTAESNISEAQIEQAKAQVETLKIQLSQTKLFSPAEGTILEKQAQAGEVVQAGATVFTFYPADPLRIEAEIYEGDIGGVFVGQEVQLEFIAFPDKTFKGQVVGIDKAPVLINGVVHYLADLQITEPPDNILPGMSVDVRF